MFFNKTYKGYYIPSENEIMIGEYHKDGGCISEMKIEWIFLNNKPVPQFQVFDDAWRTLYRFKHLFKTLSYFNNKNISQLQLIQILKNHNFKEIN